MDPNLQVLITTLLTSIIRHGFTVAAGYLVAKNILDPTQQASFVDAEVGGAMALFAVAWSYLEKHHYFIKAKNGGAS